MTAAREQHGGRPEAEKLASARLRRALAKLRKGRLESGGLVRAGDARAAPAPATDSARPTTEAQDRGERPKASPSCRAVECKAAAFAACIAQSARSWPGQPVVSSSCFPPLYHPLPAADWPAARWLASLTAPPSLAIHDRRHPLHRPHAPVRLLARRRRRWPVPGARGFIQYGCLASSPPLRHADILPLLRPLSCTVPAHKAAPSAAGL